jgi:hypothetical protein
MHPGEIIMPDRLGPSPRPEEMAAAAKRMALEQSASRISVMHVGRRGGEGEWDPADSYDLYSTYRWMVLNKGVR